MTSKTNYEIIKWLRAEQCQHFHILTFTLLKNVMHKKICINRPMRTILRNPFSWWLLVLNNNNYMNHKRTFVDFITFGDRIVSNCVKSYKAIMWSGRWYTPITPLLSSSRGQSQLTSQFYLYSFIVLTVIMFLSLLYICVCFLVCFQSVFAILQVYSIRYVLWVILVLLCIL